MAILPSATAAEHWALEFVSVRKSSTSGLIAPASATMFRFTFETLDDQLGALPMILFSRTAPVRLVVVLLSCRRRNLSTTDATTRRVSSSERPSVTFSRVDRAAFSSIDQGPNSGAASRAASSGMRSE